MDNNKAGRNKNVKIAWGVVIVVVVIVFLYFLGNNSGSKTGTTYNPISNNLSNLQTQKLATIPDDYYNSMVIGGGVAQNLSGMSFSPDGQNVVYIVKKNNKSSVYVNDTPGVWYDNVNLSSSPYSSNRHYYYSAKKDKDSFVVLDGVELKHYQNAYISDYDSAIGSTGVVAYVVNSYGTTTVVFNEHTGKSYDSIFDLKISPDGQNAVYYGCTNNTTGVSSLDSSGGCEFVIQNIDGTSQVAMGLMYSKGTSEAIYKAVIQYSPDGKILGYTNDYGLMIGGVQVWPPELGDNHNHLNIKSLFFSPDSKHAAYIVQQCNTSTCVKSSLGSETGGVYYVVLDNAIASKGYGEIQDMIFDADGGLVYFAKTGDAWSLTHGNNTYSIPTDLKKNPDFPPVFYKENYLYTYTNVDGKTVLVSNGNKLAIGDAIILPQYSADGNIIYMSGDEKTKKFWLNINGVAQTTHDVVIPFLSLPTSIYSPFYTFTSDGKIVYGAIDGQDIYRVVEPVQ